VTIMMVQLTWQSLGVFVTGIIVFFIFMATTYYLEKRQRKHREHLESKAKLS